MAGAHARADTGGISERREGNRKDRPQQGQAQTLSVMRASRAHAKAEGGSGASAKVSGGYAATKKAGGLLFPDFDAGLQFLPQQVRLCGHGLVSRSWTEAKNCTTDLVEHEHQRGVREELVRADSSEQLQRVVYPVRPWVLLEILHAGRRAVAAVAEEEWAIEGSAKRETGSRGERVQVRVVGRSEWYPGAARTHGASGQRIRERAVRPGRASRARSRRPDVAGGEASARGDQMGARDVGPDQGRVRDQSASENWEQRCGAREGTGTRARLHSGGHGEGQGAEGGARAGARVPSRGQRSEEARRTWSKALIGARKMMAVARFEREHQRIGRARKTRKAKTTSRRT